MASFNEFDVEVTRRARNTTELAIDVDDLFTARNVGGTTVFLYDEFNAQVPDTDSISKVNFEQMVQAKPEELSVFSQSSASIIPENLVGDQLSNI